MGDEGDVRNGIDRRQLAQALSLLAALAPGAAAAAEAPAPPPPPAGPPGPTVVMMIYPRMVLLDLVGPLTVFNLIRADLHLVWKDMSPVMTEVRIPIPPTTDFAGAPKNPDVLFVPGGILGTTACMKDQAVLDFLADRGSRAKYVTSVCTGSLVLGAAGLLRGYKATSLWAVADILPVLGATRVNERVVHDRNRLTGGGVTAGIDFALTLAAILTDEMAARRAQLTIEYAPAPPFRAGTPEEAGPELTRLIKSGRVGMDGMALQAAKDAAARFKA